MGRGGKRGLRAASLLPGSKSAREASKEGWSSNRSPSSEMVVIIVVGRREVKVCDLWWGAGVRADMEEIVVSGEDGGEADGGAGSDVDCDEGEFDVVIDRKEHRRGVLRPGVSLSLRRHGRGDSGRWLYHDNNTTTSLGELRSS